MRSLVILDGVKAVAQADVDANGCLAEIKTMKLPDAVSDYVCRWRPSPRRHPGFVTLNKMVLASGGYTNRTDIGSDLWYRGKETVMKPFTPTSATVNSLLFLLARIAVCASWCTCISVDDGLRLASQVPPLTPLCIWCCLVLYLGSMGQY